MPDNSVLPATGETYGSDDIGGVKYERIKQIFGADGVNEGDVSPTNPYPVSIRDKWYGPTAVPGVAAAPYAIGDQFGTLVTLTSAANASGRGGKITGVSMSDGDDLITAMDVYFFCASPSLAADNAAFTLSADADADNILWIARMTLFEDLPLNKKCTQLVGVSIPYFCSGGTSLYAAFRTQTAYTLVSTASPKYMISLEPN